MEVHHHPDLHHNRKKFREYFIEFIMIFLAVTMGFIAENIRENIVNNHREKEYMQSMLEDIKNDSTHINETISLADYISNGLDTLENMLYDNPAKFNIVNLYRLNSTYLRHISMPFSDRTSSQLKTGGMSLIKNRKIANAISEYWNGIKSVQVSEDNYTKVGSSVSEMNDAIFNKKYLHNFHADSVRKTLLMDIDSNCKLMTRDTNILVNYANRLNLQERILKTFYIYNLQAQYKRAIELMIMIKKEYEL
jgi:hypothetical protein